MKILFFLIASIILTQAKGAVYDPTLSPSKVETHLTSFSYNKREVPLKIYLPVGKKNSSKKAPVILLSHGLGGSREVGAYLGSHWAGRGFIVVAMQHVGSDDSVWKDLPLAQRFRAIKKAASKETFLDRMDDVPATIDQLEKWAIDRKSPLYLKMDLTKIGMAGHSYGAITTQGLCGQVFGAMGPRFVDKRIDAGLPLSPSKPKLGSSEKAFSNIKIPMMLMTGTEDNSVIGGTTPESRREVFPALPAGSKYELVLKDAKHMAFSDHTMTGKEHRNPNHHKVIKALSAAFWDAYLKDSKSAQQWLDGKKPYELLDDSDLWQRK